MKIEAEIDPIRYDIHQMGSIIENLHAHRLEEFTDFDARQIIEAGMTIVNWAIKYNRYLMERK